MATIIHTLVLISMCFMFGITSARSIAIRNKTWKINNESRYFEDHFNSTIECIRRQLTQGNPDTGLPSLDPWIIPDVIRLNIDNKYFWTDLKLTDLVIKGLMSFETTSLNLSHLMKLDVGYHYKKIHLRTSYEGSINLLSMLTFSGEGTIDVILTDVDIKTSTQYSMTPPLIDDYAFVVSLGKAKIRLTGMMSEDWSRYFSICASYVSTLLVNMFQMEISGLISPYIMEFYSSHIGHLAFLDFLAIISDLNCPV